MKVVSFLLFFLIASHFAFSGVLDSSLSKKRYKNQLEVGYTSAYFFDKYGMNYPNSFNFSDLQIIYLKYGRRITPIITCGASYYWYGRLYNIPGSLSTKGELNYRYYKNLSVFCSVKAKLVSSKVIVVVSSLSLDLNYRYNGLEQVYLARRSPIEIVTDGTKYHSLGFGNSFDLDIIFKNRIYFGTALSYAYYFQKPGLKVESPNSDFYKSYKANRDVLAFHPKIGFLF